MGFFSSIKQARFESRLNKLAKKCATIRKQRDVLKVRAKEAKDLYDECILNHQAYIRAAPSGTVMKPSSISSEEGFYKK